MKTAIYGTWHVHAGDYTKRAIELGEVVGVYDADAQSRKAFCEKYNLPEFSTPETLLQSDAEGVIVCSATNTHTQDILSIANAGKHIFTEKVLALTTDNCKRIEEAIQKNGVRFVISLFQKYRAAQLTMKKIAESGELGKINYMRFRNCHNGSIADWLPAHFYDAAACGGGAMIDLGAHGMYLTHWFLGMPDTFSSTFTIAHQNAKNIDGVEDNAVTVMGYQNGAIAINETGFVSHKCPPTLELDGTQGYARMEGATVRKMTASTNGEWTEVKPETECPLPIEQFLTGNVLDGCGIEEAKALTQMMEKAYMARV